MRKKILIIIPAVILALLFFFIFKGKSKANSFKVETAKVGEMNVSVFASGEIKAEKDVTLKFQTSGLLNWVGVKKGDVVRRGQAIASLDKRDLQMKLKKEMNDFMNERWDFEQTQDDYKVTKERRLVTDAIQRILDKAQFDLNNVTLDYEIADLTVKLATIYSPIDGVVINLDEPYPGVNITPSTATFRIVDPSTLYFEAEVDETEISQVKLGDKVQVSLDAFPGERFNGVVSLIEMNSTTTSGGGTAYRVRIFLSGTDQVFRLGMNGDAEMVQEAISNALLVPIAGLQEKDKKTYVWLVENDRAKKVAVVVGQTNGEQVQIVSGLKAGDQVITSNLSLLKEGMAIKP